MLDRSGQPSLKIPDQAHVSKHLRTVVFEEGGELQEMPVTHSGFLSYRYSQRADVRLQLRFSIFLSVQKRTFNISVTYGRMSG